jgi:NADP-dependent aldehyde dehydrogenase
MPLTGELFIGNDRAAASDSFAAHDAALHTELPVRFAAASAAQAAAACELAATALGPYASAPLETRARFLEACAVNIAQLGDELIERGSAESALPRARLLSERARTVMQLNLFADLVRSGSWLGLRIDHALPERTPLPRTDLRLRQIPVGPVVVFGASNFPLAFSAGGGDVASALAAGCPVVVKAHPAHPGTSELVAGAIVEAVKSSGLPSGTYSHLSGPGNALGEALVNHPAIRAVGFTGSRKGGLALLALAGKRPTPIPVYAEMSSVNPVILLPAALAVRARDLASAFVSSLTMGVGQFCTNPGLILLIDSPQAEQFVTEASALLAQVPAGTMLSQGICNNFANGVTHLGAAQPVRVLARGNAGHAGEAVAALFSVRAQDFMADRSLAEEVFGPSALIVRCADGAEVASVLQTLEGQLTATLQIEPEDLPLARSLLPILEHRAGRIIANGWPTGVEVAHAMVHGGPYPATSDGRTTSVGSLAIERFLRPVCYQNLPAALLPSELQEDNAAQYRPLIDGHYVG